MNRSELNSMTRAKLIDFGRKKKIEVTTSMTKAELVTAVAKGLKQLEKKKTPSPKPKAVSKKGSKKAAVQKKTTKKKTAAKKKSTIKTKVKSGARTAAKKKKSAVKKVLPSASRAHKKTSKKHHAALATHRKPAAGKTKSPSSQWVHSQNVEEDLAAKFIGHARGDQSAAALGGFDQECAKAQTRDNAVAAREIFTCGFGVNGKFADERSASG